MKKIVFLDEYSIAGRDLSKITSQGEYIAYNNTAKEDVVERLKGADIAITNKVMIDGDIMRQLPDLKLICVAATGMNNVDLETAKELGIVVKNAVGYSTISVAETTLASALALARNIVYFDEYFHDGRYSKADRAFCYDRLTFQISGKKWGIIGLGNIGREVARLASAFGCEVRYFSTSGAKREEAYPAMELDELLKWSDIVSVHSPLNERTRGLVGRRELQLMKPTSLIINVARGGIIDEAALAEALDNGWISAAALDVFSVEPLRESPLYNIKDRYRLLASPHNAWSAAEAIDRLIDCVAENIRTWIEAE
ncbi:MAG: NAD(P)-dependent oxidoreductase, partial [Alistipes sp.]|nr:NAD(P)-dependent oxidoreductase [Alistipes sp.]